LGAGEGADELVALSGAVEAALQPLGFKPERRTFTPHLTLGRVRGAKNAAALGELVTAAADFAAGAIHVDEVIVFSSRLERDGPVYEPLGRVPLEG
jgi:2'-5' RNA ligase